MVSVVLSSILSIIFLFFLTKLMGNRQISQLGLYDYIVGITLGSIASEMAISSLNNIIVPMMAMLCYGLVTVLFSYLTQKSLPLRRFIEGVPLVLYYDGHIYQRHLKKAKIDISEFLTFCRLNGYFDLKQLYMVVLEENGQMSFLPKEKHRPVEVTDLNLKMAQTTPLYPLIMDGKLLRENLNILNIDEKWLLSQLKTKNILDYQELTLALVDQDKQLQLYKKNSQKDTSSLFL